MTAFRWRVLVVLLVLASALTLVFTRSPRLGLDLQGGTQIVLEAQDTPRVEVTGDVADRTLEVMRRRVDALGITEPTLQRSGDRRIIVELPGVADPDEAVAVIGRTAQLAFHRVLAIEDPTTVTVPPEGETPAADATGVVVLQDEDGIPIRLSEARVTGEAVSGARASFGTGLQAAWHVEVDFRGEGERGWVELTGEAACAAPGDPARRVAIVLDTEIISSPQISPEIQCGQGITGGTTVITGQFTERSAKDLALLIRAGALPVPVEIVEQRTIGPTLGQAAIRASVEAGIIGAALTILFILFYYRLLGLLAALALLSYGVIAFAVLLGFEATLTLPGIAGFVLAIGMAVDANVLVYERAKEEFAAGRSVRGAVVTGFSRAWSAILDSNVTTLIAAILLFFFASGAVRGFGLTLTIGVVVSLFSSLVITRMLVELTLKRRAMSNRAKTLGLLVGAGLRRWLTERGPNIIGRSRLWFAISGLAAVLAVTGVMTRGVTYGIEFSGGRLIEYDTQRSIDLDSLRSALADMGLPRAVVQESGAANVAVRVPELSREDQDEVTAAVEELGGDASIVRDEFVGPTIGRELRQRALIALGLALAAQLAYLAIRFRWTYGASSVVAMFHDVIILIGLFAWLGKTFDGVFVASLLTVIGYSVNDSVVVFDRVREERHLRPKDPLGLIANDACLQTLPRTFNTGLGAMFILFGLFILGGDTLSDFALALIIGLAVGSYSSVFTAAPIAVLIEGRSKVESAAAHRPAAERKVLTPSGAPGVGSAPEVPGGGPPATGDDGGVETDGDGGRESPAPPAQPRPSAAAPRPPRPRKRGRRR